MYFLLSSGGGIKQWSLIFHLMHLCLCLPSLPKVVKRRINALKNLQVKSAHIEAKFYEEVHELERKYAALYQPLCDKVWPSYLCFFTYMHAFRLQTDASSTKRQCLYYQISLLYWCPSNFWVKNPSVFSFLLALVIRAASFTYWLYWGRIRATGQQTCWPYS